MKTKTLFSIRQGDVMLIAVAMLPVGCKPIEPEAGRRFVLAHGEVTGHAHAIYEFTADEKAEQALARAAEVTDALLTRARKARTAQMWSAPDGEWYLQVPDHAFVTKKTASVIVGIDGEPMTLGEDRVPGVALKHEEHTAQLIPPGIYHCPVQVEAGPDNMNRLVAD